MHIHLPKPLHGWREFIGEVAIIVIGVLIALGLEQVVEHLREGKLSREAQETIRAEIGSDLGQLANRMRTEPCIKRKLDELAGFIDRASGSQAGEIPHWIGRPQVWQMDATRWDAASQSGRASLLSGEDQAHFSDIYGSLKAVQESENAEQVLWAQLRSLEEQARLSETAASDMRSVLSQARLTDWRIRVAFAQSREAAEQLGIRLTANHEGSPSVCVPISSRRAEALRQINSRYGEP
jgi:hypothetical protein